MSALPKIGLLAAVLCVSACSTGTSGASPSQAGKDGTASPAAGVTVESASAPVGIAPVGAGAEVRADRQLTFATVRSGGQKMLTVGSDGVVTLTDRLGDRALFVPSPVKAGGDEYLLKTAKMIKGGEAWCLHLDSPGGTEPLNLKTTACDAGKDDQIFTFPKTQDGKGRLIEIGGLYVFAEGGYGKVVVQESGEGDAISAFTVRDQGKSTIPELGD